MMMLPGDQKSFKIALAV